MLYLSTSTLTLFFVISANLTNTDVKLTCISCVGSSGYLYENLFCRHQDLRNLPIRSPVMKRFWWWSLSILHHDGPRCKAFSFSVGVLSSLNAPFPASSSVDPTEFLADFLLLMYLRNFIYGTFCLLAFIFFFGLCIRT